MHRLTLHSAAAATSSTFSTWASGCASAAPRPWLAAAREEAAAHRVLSLGNRSRGGNRGGGSGSCRVPAGSSPVCPRADSAAGEYALPKPWNGWLWRSCRGCAYSRAYSVRYHLTHTVRLMVRFQCGCGVLTVRLRCAYCALAMRLLECAICANLVRYA
jgi:hypothetical protein